MSGHTSTSVEVSLNDGRSEDYGLHKDVLGPIETLAQSISAIAPTASPSLTIPLVFAIAGNATWFVYFVATAAMLLVGFCVSRFARLSASPGSLYTYTSENLPRPFGNTAAWALLIAYLATGASVAGGAAYYTSLLTGQFLHWSPAPAAILIAVCAVAGWVAYRDVKLSAELMLWIEAASMSFVLIVVAALFIHFGVHVDTDQLMLRGVHPSSLGPALVLAIFSFVGFESAASLGSEARNPLHTIPRAVLLCAAVAGSFFILCSYAEVLGFHGEMSKLSETTSPLHLLAAKIGLAPVGSVIDFGTMISMAACTLACATAAARLMLRMAHEGLLPKAFEKTNRKHGTPTAAVVLCATSMMVATVGLAVAGVPVETMFDWMGSLATFGFLTAYALVAVALPFARRAAGSHSHLVAAVSIVTVLIMILVAVYDLRSTSDAAHVRIPYIYLAYIAVCVLWSYWKTRGRKLVAQ
ncbi:MAG TPA: APC family permease [Terracidiphilus sp.]|nr:APC family permease [Terracidiphilus sp.]